MSEIFSNYTNLFWFLYCFCFVLSSSLCSEWVEYCCFIGSVNVPSFRWELWWVCPICSRQRLPWLYFRWLGIFYLDCAALKSRIKCMLKEAKETNCSWQFSWSGILPLISTTLYGILILSQGICNFSEKWMGTLVSILSLSSFERRNLVAVAVSTGKLHFCALSVVWELQLTAAIK